MSKPESYPQKVLHKLGLTRDIDLALHLPLRYEDETRLSRLCDARDGDTILFEGVVTSNQVALRTRRQLLVNVDDGTDTCVLRFFTFYASQQRLMAEGVHLRVHGEVRGGVVGWTMMHPRVQLAGGELPRTLTPVYPTAAGLPQPYLRKVIQTALARVDLTDTLGSARLPGPAPWLDWSLSQALHYLHQPTPDQVMQQLQDRSHPAWQRLKAEELLAQQLSQLQAKRQREHQRAVALAPPKAAAVADLVKQLLAVLPFGLTAAQRRACTEIAQDLNREVPMHRLLQGDVGSGKTVVAAVAAARCVAAGHQCVLMAPTEILAEQHFRKLVEWLQPLGVTTAWLTGSQKTKQRKQALALVASGQANLVVGTHAVLQDQVMLDRLALVIIDEQHRFGVAQRLALRAKMLAQQGSQAREPHLLMMTATPIPRTLAMSYYADLDVSTLDELPPGRTPVVTKLVQERRREQVVERIRSQIAQGRQVYWVCPLIEESEAVDLANATQTHADLVAALPGATVGLLHARLQTAQKKSVMQAFVAGQTQVLVSTTVIEVGVDVPNASLMVIEHAERFGLSQLHQLRGRVGRGAAASACVLLYSTGDAQRLGDAAKARLKAMVETSDGFEIARRDLDIRGPGEFMGSRQSGAPLLRFADLATDSAILTWARAQAARLLDVAPQQAQRHVERWLGARSDYLNA